MIMYETTSIVLRIITSSHIRTFETYTQTYTHIFSTCAFKGRHRNDYDDASLVSLPAHYKPRGAGRCALQDSGGD